MCKTKSGETWDPIGYCQYTQLVTLAERNSQVLQYSQRVPKRVENFFKVLGTYHHKEQSAEALTDAKKKRQRRIMVWHGNYA